MRGARRRRVHPHRLDPTTYRLTHLYAALKTGLNELMQIYTIKIVAGAPGRVPAIVGFDITRLRRAKVLFITAYPAQLLYALQALTIWWKRIHLLHSLTYFTPFTSKDVPRIF